MPLQGLPRAGHGGPASFSTLRCPSPSARLAARRARGRGVPASPQRIGCSAAGAGDQRVPSRFAADRLRPAEMLARLATTRRLRTVADFRKRARRILVEGWFVPSPPPRSSTQTGVELSAGARGRHTQARRLSGHPPCGIVSKTRAATSLRCLPATYALPRVFPRFQRWHLTY